MQKIKIFFDKLNRRERHLIFFTLSILGLVFARIAVVGEICHALEIHRETEQAKQEIQNLKGTLGRTPASDSQSLRSDPLWRYVKENKGVASLVKVISARAKDSPDFMLRKVSSEKFETGPDFEKATLLVEVDTPFNTLGAFLESLEGSHLLTRVESVRVTRTNRELKLCRANIQLQSFYWRDL